MMQALDAVLFDLDGTLLDTAPDFYVVVNQLCRNHDRPDISYADIRATVSHGARALITLAFDLKEGDTSFEDRRQELLSLYGDHLAVKTELFAGLPSLLSWLEQESIHWGIVTNKPRLYAEPILTALALDQRCGVLVCPDDVTRTKPDPEALLLACRQLNCRPENSLYVGDHRRDIEAGQRAGMRTVAAGYGYVDPSDPSQSWGADHHIDEPDTILPLIQREILAQL